MGDSVASGSSDPLIGKVLDGRYTLLELIGSGGMGRVYKAMQLQLGRVVALKLLKPARGVHMDPGFQRRFFLEASLTARLHHPNTIVVHDFGKAEDGTYYIAMEWVQGDTLKKLLAERGPLPWERALNIGQQVCRSVREAHRLGLVHRDLKPANVMVAQEETYRDLVKVLDFGLVKSFAAESDRRVTYTELTEAGAMLGSPKYMAPEQAMQEADPRSDIYSVGVMLYEMLSGAVPFDGQEAVQIITRHIHEKPQPLSSRAPQVPAGVSALVMRCLEKDPAARFQSMDELLEAMRHVTASGGLSAPPRPTEDGPSGDTSRTEPALAVERRHRTEVVERPRDRNARTWALLAAALVVVASAVGLWWLRRPVAAKREPTRPPVVERPAAPPPAPAAQPMDALVRFDITSVPTQAQVTLDGQPLGSTPLQIERAAGASGEATLTITLSAKAHTPKTVTLKGRPPVTSTQVVLQPVESRPQGSPYKEDPYR